MSDHSIKRKQKKWYHLVNTVLEDTRNAFIGILLMIISLPFYFYRIRKR